jgi:hypothetical protein
MRLLPDMAERLGIEPPTLRSETDDELGTTRVSVSLVVDGTAVPMTVQLLDERVGDTRVTTVMLAISRDLPAG